MRTLNKVLNWLGTDGFKVFIGAALASVAGVLVYGIAGMVQPSVDLRHCGATCASYSPTWPR